MQSTGNLDQHQHFQISGESIFRFLFASIDLQNPRRLRYSFSGSIMAEGGKSAKLNQHHQNGHFSRFRLAKLVDPEASWDKDQLGDVLHWIRQVVALLCGLLWGTIPLVGGIWIMLFVVLSSGIIYGYYVMILKVDEEEFGGHGALLQEGLFASFTLFLLAWVLVYSLAHF